MLAWPFYIVAQTGPGGVGASDGSSTLEVWVSPDSNVYTTAAFVDSLRDFSGKGVRFSSSGTNRPDLVPNGINGRNYLEFNRANFEKLDIGAGIAAIGVNDHRTIMYAFSFNIHAENVELMGTFTKTMIDYGYWGVNNDRIRLRSGTTNAYTPANSISQNTWHINTISYNGTNTTVWSDGVQLVQSTANCFGWAIDNNFDLGAADYIGRSFQGYLGEVIIFSKALNTVERMIVENYLVAKYGLPLVQNDLYRQDDVAQGDYDYDVAGLGRLDASTLHQDAQGMGIVRVLNPTGLDDNEFMLWGHDDEMLQAIRSDVPATVQARLKRVWRISEVNMAGTPVDVGAVDMQFDLTGLGSITATDLRLLVDTDNDGIFSDEAPIAGAVHLGGSTYGFDGVTALADGLRFTLGTSDRSQTPLPVEWLSFEAQPQYGQTVALTWRTAAETHNDFFTVERAHNGIDWRAVTTLTGAGSAADEHRYTAIDAQPLAGLSYYRIKQTDFDGRTTYSKIESVRLFPPQPTDVKIFPNPTKGLITITSSTDALRQLALYNTLGQDITPAILIEEGARTLDLSGLKPGIYYLKTLTTTHKIYKQ